MSPREQFLFIIVINVNFKLHSQNMFLYMVKSFYQSFLKKYSCNILELINIFYQFICDIMFAYIHMYVHCIHTQ